MARPRLVANLDDVQDTYQRTGSVRATARALKISRWAVVRRLEELGIQPRDRDEALAQVRLVKEDIPTKTEESTEVRGKPGAFGCTVIRHLRTVQAHPCIWPNCSNESSGGVICAEHQLMLEESAGGRCRWPHCPESPMSGPLCYHHDKRARGVT